MRLQTGTLLHGDTYKIEKVLGQGSFGITYLAVHMVLERKVCIKEFFMKEINTRNVDGSITGMTDGSLSYNYGQKFKKEALNLSRLDHPNIVRVTDSFEENGTYYYVMDYIDGDNLNEYLKDQEVTQKEALDIIRNVATALMYMHEEKKMLHLDLKPGNIMRRHGDGHIFLIDFGLSKHYSSDGQPETSTSIGLGTAGYAPIEQANQMKSGEFRPTIDVYALGATLFKLLTRETPPQASEIVSDDKLIESKLRANGITGPIIDVVVNSMLLNARKRTQSVKKFLDALSEEELADEPKEDSKSQKPTLVIKEEETEILGSQEFFEESNWCIPAKYVNNPAVTAEKANNGETDAMFAYGMMLLRGQGVGQSMDIARSYFMKAQAEGDARAQKVIDDWEILKKKYERKRTKTNVGVVEKDNIPACPINARYVGVLAFIGILGIVLCKFAIFEEYDVPYALLNCDFWGLIAANTASLCLTVLFAYAIRQTDRLLYGSFIALICIEILCFVSFVVYGMNFRVYGSFDYVVVLGTFTHMGIFSVMGIHIISVICGMIILFKCEGVKKSLGLMLILYGSLEIIKEYMGYYIYEYYDVFGMPNFYCICELFLEIMWFGTIWWILTRKDITKERMI